MLTFDKWNSFGLDTGSILYFFTLQIGTESNFFCLTLSISLQGLWPLRSEAGRETDDMLVLSFVGQTR